MNTGAHDTILGPCRSMSKYRHGELLGGFFLGRVNPRWVRSCCTVNVTVVADVMRSAYWYELYSRLVMRGKGTSEHWRRPHKGTYNAQRTWHGKICLSRIDARTVVCVHETELRYVRSIEEMKILERRTTLGGLNRSHIKPSLVHPWLRRTPMARNWRRS